VDVDTTGSQEKKQWKSRKKTMFSSRIGHSGEHWSKLRTTFGFSRTYNCNKVYQANMIC
jgi:hypothetical protein